MTKLFYSIKDKVDAAGNPFTNDLLGGKGFNLGRMVQAGVNVPPAYVITTEACAEYAADPAGTMLKVREEILPAICEGLKAEFGFMPLVSVRSGAKFSMPGMMDTILNVGLAADTISEWTERLGAHCANDSFRRLYEMYSDVVLGIDGKKFEGKTLKECRVIYKAETGAAFPSADAQLLGAVEAVFKSWNNDRAKTYRKINNIPDSLGTAVVVQAMVFGNFDESSATGVLFTRDPSNGVNEVVGEFLINAQGEDVVAGTRTPSPLSGLVDWNPAVAEELLETVTKLEVMNSDMQDVEFTIQSGKLFILQTRNGKRTAQATVQIALDLLAEEAIDSEEVLRRVTLKQYLAASRPTIPAAWLEQNPAHGVGIPASNGCVTGVAVFSNEAAINCTEPCILIAKETTPDDIGGMNASRGILTSTGGATSHAAVVARGMDKVCVVGCTALKQTLGKWTISDGNVVRTIKEGTKITLDGTSGKVWIDAEVPIIGGADSELSAQVVKLLSDKFGFYRTCTTVAEVAMGGKVLVATYEIDRKYTGADAHGAMLDLFYSIDGGEAVLDLSGYDSVCRDADAPLEFVWGKPASLVGIKVTALLGMKEEGNMPSGVTVLEKGISAYHVAKLHQGGIPTVPAVTTVSELLKANGLCVPDFDKLLSVMTKQDVARVIELKKKAGEKVQSFNIVDQVGPEDFGRSAMFALSAEQAVQSLLVAE